MKKHLTIIGGGFSSWIAASVFADSGYSIDIFEGKKKFWIPTDYTQWLESIIKPYRNENIQKYIEPFYSIYIKKLNSNNEFRNFISS